jgi:hypothetical protein
VTYGGGLYGAGVYGGLEVPTLLLTPPAPSSRYRIQVYDRDLALLGEIDDYQSLEMIVRFNAVGTWVLDLDANTLGAQLLLDPGRRVVVTRDDMPDDPIFSGPVTKPRRKRDVASDRREYSGTDDLCWVANTLAKPQPATAIPPYNTQAYDTRTGTCSTILRQYVDVNAGPSATGDRRIPGLTLAPDLVLGTSVTGQARWQNLLELLSELALAGGGLGFKATQVGTDIEFAVYEPEDLTDVITFGWELGNLADLDYSAEAPEANRIVCGGGGEETARIIREGQDPTSIATWGRIEMFRDRRDTTDTAQLDQTITEELEEKAEKISLSATPVDIPQFTYRTHYDLGDRVTVAVDDDTIVSEVIREVQIKLTPDGGEQIRAQIGTPGRQSVLALFDSVRRHNRRLTDLERR